MPYMHPDLMKQCTGLLQYTVYWIIAAYDVPDLTAYDVRNIAVFIVPDNYSLYRGISLVNEQYGKKVSIRSRGFGIYTAGISNIIKSGTMLFIIILPEDAFFLKIPLRQGLLMTLRHDVFWV